jgi:phage shock protein A
MSIFSKIMTAVRGGANEVGEAVIDANATRIFEQEIRDATGHITTAKRDLTGIMGLEIAAKRTVAGLKEGIAEHEGYAIQAMEKGDETLALSVAEKIASLEESLATEQAGLSSYESQSKRLKDVLKKSEKQVLEHKRQLSMVKTTESVQKATAAISDNFSSSNSKLLGAKDSLERIKAKQQKFDDQMMAAESLEAEGSGASLEAQLKEAGIGGGASSANSILDRLKAKQK